MMKKEYFTTLSIGNTGVGKSELGNCILKTKAFESGCGGDAVTLDCQYKHSFNDGDMAMIDTPGLNDASTKDDQILKKVVKFIKENTMNLHTLCIVFNYYNSRFDEGIKKMVMLYLALINDIDFISNICLVFTHCKKPEERDELNDWNVQVATLQKEFPTKIIQCFKDIYGAKKEMLARIEKSTTINCYFIDSKNKTNEYNLQQIDQLTKFIRGSKSKPTEGFIVPDFARLKIIDVDVRERKISSNRIPTIDVGAFDLIEEFVEEEANIWECYDNNHTTNDEYKEKRRYKIEKHPTISKEYDDEMKMIDHSVVNENVEVYKYEKAHHKLIENPDGNKFDSISKLMLSKMLTKEIRERKEQETKVPTLDGVYELHEFYVNETRVLCKWSNQEKVEDGPWKEVKKYQKVIEPKYVRQYEDDWVQVSKDVNPTKTIIKEKKISHIIMINPDGKQIDVKNVTERTITKNTEARTRQVNERRQYNYKGQSKLFQLIKEFVSEEREITQTGSVTDRSDWNEIKRNEKITDPVLVKHEESGWYETHTTRETAGHNNFFQGHLDATWRHYRKNDHYDIYRNPDGSEEKIHVRTDESSYVA